MDVVGPSQTALATARARAYHQIADDPTVLVDPLAARLLGVSSEELSALGKAADGRPDSGVPDRPRRLFFAARARFAEDCIASAADRGVGQVVILGAGMDTFAFRNPHVGVRVFEVDHPATLQWKRRRLADAGIEVSDAVSFVPVDFEIDSLAAELESAGLRRTDPAVFVWLGVVFYLTTDAVRATLDHIAGQAGPTEVVLDYLQPADSDEARAQLRARADRLAASGEPWFSYFTADEISKRLRALGFSNVQDFSAAELVDGYSSGTTRYGLETPDALRASRILRATR